jgi:hypothetical protein
MTPKQPRQLDIEVDETTVTRFENLVRQVLSASPADVKKADNEFKAERLKRRAAKRKVEKSTKNLES